ncbi:hypothetical protein CONPUDRAFT_72350 [Coniophora puteana RWD-64-598 SS2]|uniref:Uncharacterized protein n=1 Tax=Coniophora puteana (strain RWD-64-598) TaxID=741705 RepID=A0A5M3MS85_CONPW|nr:uncharacterized protein CONPUDRAFT_72350 [Coniophora puteana RWD-64-598 SS2]EIW82013.1 hypothetical protein CONPUDRAFT_72350 [Coniophora puteana RWD-64-598 SS2]
MALHSQPLHSQPHQSLYPHRPLVGLHAHSHGPSLQHGHGGYAYTTGISHHSLSTVTPYHSARCASVDHMDRYGSRALRDCERDAGYEYSQARAALHLSSHQPTSFERGSGYTPGPSQHPPNHLFDDTPDPSQLPPALQPRLDHTHGYFGYPGAGEDPAPSEINDLCSRLVALSNMVKEQAKELVSAKETCQLMDQVITWLEEQQATINAQAVARQSKSETKKGKGNNTHKDAKREVHKSFAILCGLKKSLSRDGRSDELHEKKQRKHGKAELSDDNFKATVIHAVTSGYFISSTAEGSDHALGRTIRARRRGQCQTVAHARRLGTKKVEHLFPNAITVVNTDFCTEQETCDEGIMTEDLKWRRDESKIGLKARMGIVLEWRSIELVAFLQWLSVIAYKESSEEPARKRAQLDETDAKKTLDALVSMLMWCGSHLIKRKPTLPFELMVDPRWTEINGPIKMLQGNNWLRTFCSILEPGALTELDEQHLAELERWKEDMYATREVQTQLQDTQLEGEIITGFRGLASVRNDNGSDIPLKA